MGSEQVSFAIGLRDPNQDVEAAARGNAFVATANNPGAIYYNPAGITQLQGQQVQFGIRAVMLDFGYRSLSGAESSNRFDAQPVPNFYYTNTPKNSPWSFGIGIYSPFGLGVEWPETTGFRTVGLEGKLKYLTVNPTAAYKISDQLSIGFGPTMSYGKLLFREGIATPGDEFKYKGESVDFSEHVGILWKPFDRWSIGVNYQAPATADFSGNVMIKNTIAERSNVSVNIPQVVAFGAAYTPNKKWNFEIDLDWTNWDTLNTIIFKRASGDTRLALNWGDSFMVKNGATYYFDNHYFVSAGYFWSQNSLPDKNFTPLVPDTDLHTVSFGTGFIGERWKWAITYQLTTAEDRNVTAHESTSAIGETANGRYSFFYNTVSISIGYKF